MVLLSVEFDLLSVGFALPDGKHDVEGRRNSFAYEIFEKNINVPLQGVEVGTLLGRGGFGKVYKGRQKLDPFCSSH